MDVKRVGKEDIELVKQISSRFKNKETRDRNVKAFIDNGLNYIIVEFR